MRQLLTTGTRGNPTIDSLSVDAIAYLSQVIEKVGIKGVAIPSSTTINASDGSIHYYDVATAANWSINITDTIDLNTSLDVGQAITVVVMATQSDPAYYNTAVTVDGSAATVSWLGGTAPAAGTVDGIDVYTYTVMKTADATFTVIASINAYA
tara:strand:- start:154 stop:612 length:459 start_codon:yes stop_codon:yes gene_type:complete